MEEGIGSVRLQMRGKSSDRSLGSWKLEPKRKRQATVERLRSTELGHRIRDSGHIHILLSSLFLFQG